ncbi:MAG: VWA domain-containing protein [Acidovorax sp.]|uniref:vWA domain-containing protein n=1 Tax=Acidovorax sp. TaxID=1872122 RepID=UPI0039E67E29
MAGAALDWPATLRARRSQPLAAEHLRWRQHLGQPQALHVFALDCSASMLDSGAFARAKGLLLQWLRWAYLQRAPVALLCFGAGQVQWRLPPRRAPQWNADLIEPLHGGGGTPLALALHAAWALMKRRPEERKVLWAISDFRSPDVWGLARQAGPQGIAHVLVDAEAPGVRAFGGARRLAHAWPDTARILMK